MLILGSNIVFPLFARVDKNGDHFITLAELEEWIIDKVQEHFDEANEETERIFKHLDTDNRGICTVLSAAYCEHLL